ncbi:hypothetical protein [Amycolatopsis sp. 3B14]|uniref:hypothetical protein n=1 Tax=Amycolatopsis sp. 3B14 TaxID=3243600 RepID=UPI003D97B874
MKSRVRRAAVAVIGVFALTGCSGATGTPPAEQHAAFAPRFDGLYAGRISVDPNRVELIRYFPNGDAYEANIHNVSDPDEKLESMITTYRELLRPGGGKDLGPWKYNADGSFTATSYLAPVTATISNFTPDAFDVHLDSRVPRYVATVHLTFSPDR